MILLPYLLFTVWNVENSVGTDTEHENYHIGVGTLAGYRQQYTQLAF